MLFVAEQPQATKLTGVGTAIPRNQPNSCCMMNLICRYTWGDRFRDDRCQPFASESLHLEHLHVQIQELVNVAQVQRMVIVLFDGPNRVLECLLQDCF